MRTNSLCGLHKVPPRADQTLPFRSARCSSLKALKTADAKGDLAVMGSWVANSALNTRKTSTLQELEALLAAVPVDASAEAYRTAIPYVIVLGKRTLSTCKQTNPRLTAMQGLGHSKLLFRILLVLLAVDPPPLTPKIALLNNLSHDPLLLPPCNHIKVMAQREVLAHSRMVTGSEHFSQSRHRVKLDTVALAPWLTGAKGELGRSLTNTLDREVL